MFVSIRGQYSGAHFCESLEANDNRIEYTLSQPSFTKNEFIHMLSIRGYVWDVVYKSSGAAPVTLQKEYGKVYVNGTKFFGGNYVSAFGVRYQRQMKSVLIGGLTVSHSFIFFSLEIQSNIHSNQNDFREIIWIFVEPQSSRRRRQSETTTPDPKWIYSFDTDFNEIGFRPQVAFNTLSNIQKNIAYFLEIKAGDQTAPNLQKRILAFSINHPSVDFTSKNYYWKNVTSEEVANIPTTLLKVIMESQHIIKGIFSIRMEGSSTGYIFLFEVCSTNAIPCTGVVSLEYCVVKDSEENPTDEGKPVIIIQ